jgi:hypothetical protein
MPKTDETQKGQMKQDVYQAELEKLTITFKDIEEPKRQLVSGLIMDAAFLFAENAILRQSLVETGMVKVHPNYPDIQKPVESSRQYLKNVNSYAVIIKTLNGVLSKNPLDDGDDGLDEFE